MTMRVRARQHRLMTLAMRLAGDLIATLGPRQRRLCILTYHRILEAPDPLLESEVDLPTFRWQMQLLADGFHVLPLAEALQRLQQGSLPPRAVCVTFDDGYRSAYELALPVLRELGLTATIFTTTAHMDGGSMWNDRIIEAVRLLPDGPVDWRVLGLDLALPSVLDAGKRVQVATELSEYAKYLAPGQRLRVIAALEQFAGNPAAPDLMLSRDMIAALPRHGIEIGGHTVTHPILAKLDDDHARREITDNKATLEQITGHPLRLFAYPNGKVGTDYDTRHVRMVSEAGYAAAFTTATGAAGPDNDRYQVPRSRPWDATPFLFGLRLLRWLANRGV